MKSGVHLLTTLPDTTQSPRHLFSSMWKSGSGEGRGSISNAGATTTDCVGRGFAGSPLAHTNIGENIYEHR